MRKLNKYSSFDNLKSNEFTITKKNNDSKSSSDWESVFKYLSKLRTKNKGLIAISNA